MPGDTSRENGKLGGRPRKPMSEENRAQLVMRKKLQALALEKADELFALLMKKALEGDERSMFYLVDQVMGKAPQSITHSGDPDNPASILEVFMNISDKYGTVESQTWGGDSSTST